MDDVLYVACQTSLFRAQVVEGSLKTGVAIRTSRSNVGPPTTVFGLR